MYKDVTFRLSAHCLDCLDSIYNNPNYEGCFSSLDSVLEYCILTSFNLPEILRRAREDSCN